MPRSCMWAEWKAFGTSPDEEVPAYACDAEATVQMSWTWTSDRPLTDVYVVCHEHAARALADIAFDMAFNEDFAPERWVIEVL